MNKTELVDAVAQASGLPKVSAAKAVNATLDVISDALKAGDSVVLTGFGTFAMRERPARTAHNPKTRQPIELPASKTPVFKPGKVLKDAVK